MESDSPKEGEVLPPEKTEEGLKVEDGVNIYTQIIQSISHYTDRPDLLLKTIEEHDPGFIRRMNESAREYSEKLRNGRLRFGEIQAYISQAVRVVAAAVILGTFFYAVHIKYASFWLIVAMVLFFAVAQSGTSGFARLTRAISNLVEKRRSDDDKI